MFFVLATYSWRAYKKWLRRCRKCGSMWHNMRINKIRMSREDMLEIEKPFKFIFVSHRWVIYRVDTETFSKCLDCKRIELVKTSKGPITLWHALWVKRFHKDQYIDDPELISVGDRAARERRKRDYLQGDEHTESPPQPSLSQILPPM